MKDETGKGDDVERDEAVLAKLLQLAGNRAPVPKDIESRVYRNVQDEWRTAVEQPDGKRVYDSVQRHWRRARQRSELRRWGMPLALAASLFMAIYIGWQPSTPVPAVLPVGTVARIIATDDPGSLPAIEQSIYPGDTLATSAGQGLTLRLNNAESLRLDEETELLVQAANSYQLRRGRVYADTGDFVARDKGLVIETGMGRVTDIGTQFIVAIDGSSLDVAVREGRVDVEQDSALFVAVAGERLRVDQNAEATVSALAPIDPYWSWATALAPTFDIENKSLLDFLRWAARETGRELVVESHDLRMEAMRTDLHGSIAGLDPLQAVESVLPTTRFRYRIETDRIVLNH